MGSAAGQGERNQEIVDLSGVGWLGEKCSQHDLLFVAMRCCVHAACGRPEGNGWKM